MLKKTYPHIPEGAKAAVYIEQEITPENEKIYLDNWSELLEKYQASLDNCWLGMDTAQKEELAQFRHAVPEHINELFKQHKSLKLATDIAVPADKFKEMFDFYNDELQMTNDELMYIKFGHIGENHLHINLLPKSEEEKTIAKDLIMRFVKKSVSLGGTISAEHGVGKIKHAYLKEMYGDAGIKEMIRIKKIFDPKCILGRNNIFPQELL
jgi:D-lactate dehydrogenase (cytochrome)